MSALAHSHPESEQPAHPVSALALVETFTATEVFSGKGLDSIIERIENEARTIALDISTDKGRKEVASLAHKIAKSKTALDKMGKELVAGWKEQAKKVDAERSRAWDRLEALQKEIRSPLTEWENREKDRVAKHEANLVTIANLGNHCAVNWQSLPIDVMKAKATEVCAYRDWQEFGSRANAGILKANDQITAAIAKRQAHEAEQAELARLRKDEEERKQREHEQRIAAESAEKARMLAEEKAKREAETEAARVKVREEEAEHQRLRLQWERDEADARALQAEQEKQAVLDKAERDRVAAIEQARRDAEEAAQVERQRLEAEQRAELAAKAAREADKLHREKINGEVLESLLSVLAGENLLTAGAAARAVVEAIAKRQIPHTTISY